MKLTQRMYGRGGLSTALGFLKSDRGKGILKTVGVEAVLGGINMLPEDMKNRVISRIMNKQESLKKDMEKIPKHKIEKGKVDADDNSAEQLRSAEKHTDVFFDTVEGSGSKKVSEKRRRAIISKLIDF